ncbi:hypothetical protein [Roseivirga thermotolerans]|uniref:hypothetical protein n=1 Tax=Roseivirga thermotolerans TaxID=1758176 RepID=UPI00273E0620|nr:hypothetical protein [Roseivirga thermotolerans]
MEVLNKIFDKRIKALNILLEMTIKEYNDISQEIIRKNEFQRRRVKSSSTVYSLLKSDLLQGCVIPPIVLALSKFKTDSIEEEENEEIIKQILANKENLVILDGLQRTYTIRDLVNELDESDDKDSKEKLLKYKLRIEAYIGIDKLGILYRMLTLNTGQTPMSIRHQIEILYSDYLVEDLGEIKFITEADDNRPTKFGEYKFKDIVEGFNSYLERDYLTIDRFDILDNIKSLEKLSKENQDKDLFLAYVNTYHCLSKLFVDAAKDWEFVDDQGNRLTGQPFGKTVEKIFSKSQVMTGFGSAIGKLIDFELIDSIDEVLVEAKKIDLSNLDSSLGNLTLKLDNVRTLAKKIGNDQRMFFHFLFRELFDRKGDAYLDFNASIEEAYKSYERKTQ